MALIISNPVISTITGSNHRHMRTMGVTDDIHLLCASSACSISTKAATVPAAPGLGNPRKLKWCCSPCSLLTLNRANRSAAQLR